MTDDHKSHVSISHLAALMALPVLIIAASISASNTQQDLAVMDSPSAIYGASTPAATTPEGQ